MDLQNALDRIPNPVGLVLAGDQENPAVITVSWFTQVSRHPPLVAVSISPNTSVTPIIATKRQFVLALLGGNSEHVARTCGHHADVVPDKVKEANLTLAGSTRVSAPAVKEALVNVECHLVQQIIVGEHALYVARAEVAHIGAEGKQLIYADRDLFSL